MNYSTRLYSEISITIDENLRGYTENRRISSIGGRKLDDSVAQLGQLCSFYGLFMANGFSSKFYYRAKLFPRVAKFEIGYDILRF